MNLTQWITKNASTILTALACVGVAATAVLSSKAALKSEMTKKEWVEEKHGDPLTKFEEFQASVKHYVPAVVVGAATVGCIVGSHKIDKKTVAAVTSAAAITTKAYDDYRRTNIEVNGEEAHEKVMEKLAVQKAKTSYIHSATFFDVTSMNSKLSKEEFLFYDTITETYFTSTLAAVIDAEAALNRNFTMGCWEVDVDMWCSFLGIENTRHDRRGWCLCDDLTWIDFNNSDPVDIGDGLEAIIISTPWTPILDYLDWGCRDEWPTQ